MSHRLKYPYKWAAAQVNSFVEKYGRGTYFLAKLLDCSPGEVRQSLVMWLAKGNSLRFEALKQVIKYMESYTMDDLRRVKVKDRKALYKCYLFIAEDDALDAKSVYSAIDSVGQRELI